MSSLTQNNVQSDQKGFRPESTDSRISCPLRVLFIHRDADTVESCLQELKKAQFAVSADIALNLAQCAEQLRSSLMMWSSPSTPVPVGMERRVCNSFVRRWRRSPFPL